MALAEPSCRSSPLPLTVGLLLGSICSDNLSDDGEEKRGLLGFLKFKRRKSKVGGAIDDLYFPTEKKLSEVFLT